nr:hypothetical protein GCM10020092_013850 [Actinoplanes digitatis]
MADAVVAHLFSRVAPGVDVVFLDTGLHFPETLKIRDTVARTMNVNVRSIRPRMTVGQQDGEFGPRLFARSPDECCFLRKVEPLERALSDYDSWATGLRRDESPTRANTPRGGVRREEGQGQGQPHRGVDAGGRRPLHRAVERAGQRALQEGVRVDRLLAVHPAHEGRRGPARGPLGDVREDRMRPARLAVVLVAHGSRDPRAAAATESLARAVGDAYPLWDVRAAYLDHSVPRPRQVLADFEARGHGRAVLVPLLLTAAYHGRVDVPGEIAAARADGLGMDVETADVLGPFDGQVSPLLLGGLEQRLGEAAPGGLDAVVLAAAGTRDSAARATVVRAAAALGERLGGCRAGSLTRRRRRRFRVRLWRRCVRRVIGGWASRPTSWLRGCSTTTRCGRRVRPGSRPLRSL